MVPSPGADVTSKLPPCARIRSRAVAMPMLFDVRDRRRLPAKPRPSSHTVACSPPRRSETLIATLPAPDVPADVDQRLPDRAVGQRLDIHRVAAAEPRAHGHLGPAVVVQRLGQITDRRTQAGRLEQLRPQLEGEPAGAVRGLRERRAGLRDGTTRRLHVAASQVPFAAVELEQRRDHHLDRVVVQLARDPRALLALGVDDLLEQRLPPTLDVAQRLLVLALVGDVAVVEHDPAHGRVVQQVGGDALDPAPRAVAVPQPELTR